MVPLALALSGRGQMPFSMLNGEGALLEEA